MRITRANPLKGPQLLITGGDVNHQTLDKLVPRLEDAAANRFARENAEPDFGLIQPTGVTGCEGQLKALLFCNPGHRLLAAPRRAVVEDHAKILIRIRQQQLAQESNEGDAVISLNGGTELTAVDLQAGQQ